MSEPASSLPLRNSPSRRFINLPSFKVHRGWYKHPQHQYLDLDLGLATNGCTANHYISGTKRERIHDWADELPQYGVPRRVIFEEWVGLDSTRTYRFEKDPPLLLRNDEGMSIADRLARYKRASSLSKTVGVVANKVKEAALLPEGPTQSNTPTPILNREHKHDEVPKVAKTETRNQGNNASLKPRVQNCAPEKPKVPVPEKKKQQQQQPKPATIAARENITFQSPPDDCKHEFLHCTRCKAPVHNGEHASKSAQQDETKRHPPPTTTASASRVLLRALRSATTTAATVVAITWTLEALKGFLDWFVVGRYENGIVLM